MTVEEPCARASRQKPTAPPQAQFQRSQNRCANGASFPPRSAFRHGGLFQLARRSAQGRRQSEKKAAQQRGANAKSSTRQSSRTSSARGRPPGQIATNGRSPAASNTPSAPPVSPNTALSVRHWRTNRPRPAPSATRMASSRSRETARASSKLATFTHAISSTRLPRRAAAKAWTVHHRPNPAAAMLRDAALLH